MNSSVEVCLNQLLSNARAAGVPRNVVVSPVSLRAAVAMLGLGCSGKSLDQVLHFFAGFKSTSSPNPDSDKLKERFSISTGVLNQARIQFVNAAWIDERRSFTPSYEQLLRDTFKADVKTQDFVNQGDEAVKDMNSWVDDHTNGLIKSFVTDIDPSTAVILGSALYFKGRWTIAFDDVASKDFYLEDGEKVSDVAFMISSNKEYYYHGSFDGYSAVDIPCANRLAIRFFLPDERDGLKDMLEKMKEDPKLLDSKFMESNNFEFCIPKFKFSYSTEKIDLGFENMDLGEMLQPAESGGEDIVQMIQKLRLEVDEKGTKAADIDPFPLWFRERSKFVADHPFMFTIKDRQHDVVIFLGTVMNPLQDGEN